MNKIETAAQLANACLDVARNFDTLYVLGCCGAPMTQRNKERYLDAYSFNRKASRKKAIGYAGKHTFGFDCVCLIKSLLWGWHGDQDHVYGGAAYKANGVPDVNADGMIQLCRDVSTDFSCLQVGEVLWNKGHIGVYVGDGLAVECTYRWADGVQVTAVYNLSKTAASHGRKWTKHGKLPYVSYEETPETKIDPARSFSKSMAGTYTVKSSGGLNLRTGASTKKSILETMKNGSRVICYGYFTGDWLYVVSPSGKEGFCHGSLLKKEHAK